MKEITSSENAIFKKYIKLLKSSGIKKEGLSLACGSKIVEDLLVHHPQSIDAVLSTSKIGFPNLLKNKHIQLTTELFQEFDLFATKSPIAVVKIPEFKTWEKKPPVGLELLVPVQDPSNLGAIVRSAYAFGVKKVVLLKESAHPFHPKSIRTSSGYVMDMQFEVGPSIQELSEISNVVALDMNGIDLNEFKWPKNCYLLVGEEGLGIPKTLKTQKIKIQMIENCESLNAVVATSIALSASYQSNQ